MECISKVELTGLADGLDEGVWQMDCKHNLDPSRSLHLLSLPCNFEVSSASVSGLDHVSGFDG